MNRRNFFALCAGVLAAPLLAKTKKRSILDFEPLDLGSMTKVEPLSAAEKFQGSMLAGHSHSISDPGHSHSIADPGHHIGNPNWLPCDGGYLRWVRDGERWTVV